MQSSTTTEASSKASQTVSSVERRARSPPTSALGPLRSDLYISDLPAEELLELLSIPAAYSGAEATDIDLRRTPPKGVLRYPLVDSCSPSNDIPSPGFVHLAPPSDQEASACSSTSFPNRPGVSSWKLPSARTISGLINRITRLRLAIGLSVLLPGSGLGAAEASSIRATTQPSGASGSSLSKAEYEWLSKGRNRRLVGEGVQFNQEEGRQASLDFAAICSVLEDRAEGRMSPLSVMSATTCLSESRLQQTRRGSYDELIDWIPSPGMRDLLIGSDRQSLQGYVEDVVFFFLQFHRLHLNQDDLGQCEVQEQFMRLFPDLIDDTTLSIANKWRQRRNENHISTGQIQKWSKELGEEQSALRGPGPV